MRRRHWAIATALLVALALLYAISPFWVSHRLKSAAASGNVDQLETMVDFPSVRQNLKEQINASMVEDLNEEMDGDNPFSGLAVMLVPAMVDRMIDAMVTPSGVAAIAQGRKPGESIAQMKPDVEYRMGYVSPDRFRIRTHHKTQGVDGPSFLLERRGIFAWQMTRIELPADQIEAPK